MKKFCADLARDILDTCHNAWSRGEIERMLSHCTEDLYYWCNAGFDGSPYILEGKPAYRTFLMSIVSVAESATATEHFQLEDGVGRAKVEAYIRHRRTGYVLSGTYRQIVTFRGRKIAKIEEYHDAAKMAAFWRLVTCDQPVPSDETIEDAK